MNNLLTILLMAGSKDQSPFMSLLPLLLIVIVFYFFMIRPQMKKQKEMKNFRQTLKVGDKIITSGGVYGKIAEMRENAVIMEVEDKMRMKVDIASVFRDPSDLESKK
jgi:preprotein translocase subunit YajC